MLSNPDLRAMVLLDGCRGSRGKTNSRTMLQPLLQSSRQASTPAAGHRGTTTSGVAGDCGRVTALESQLHVALYQTPEIPRWLRRFIPTMYNEVVSLQHMKVYLFDDDVVLSG